MEFDLRSAIYTIGPLEPALLLSLLAASGLAWLAGRRLRRLYGKVRDPWRRALYVAPAWPLGAIAMFVLPNVLVALAYPMMHREARGAMVCVAMVWPTFVLPAGVFLVASFVGRARPDTQALQD